MGTAMVTGELGKSTKRFSWPIWLSDKLVEKSGQYIYAGVPLVLWMLDQRGNFVLSEGEGLAALGLTTSNVIGRSAGEVLSDFPEIIDSINLAFDGQSNQGVVNVSDMVWQGSYYPVHGSDGKINSVVGVAFDITDQQKYLLEQETVLDLANTLAAINQKNVMPAIVFHKLSDVLAVDSMALVLVDSRTDDFVVYHSQGVWEYIQGAQLTANNENWLAVKTNHILTTVEAYIDNHYSDNPKFVMDQAVAGVPLIACDTQIGVLWTCRSTAFIEDEVRLLSAIGDLTAQAIQRADQHERMERRSKRITALHAIDLALSSSSLDLPVTLSVFLDQVIRHLDVNAADIYLYDPQNRVMKFAEGRGFQTQHVNHESLPVNEGLVGQVALSRQIVGEVDLAVAKVRIARQEMISQEKFTTYFGIPLIARGKLKGVMEIFHRQRLDVDDDWTDFLKTLAMQAANAIDNADLFASIQRTNVELDQAYLKTLEGWVRALDLRDKGTEGHTQRVTKRTIRLARAMGISENDLVQIQRGALLHDIGKIGIPDNILKKPHPLDEEEWDLMRKHPIYAYEMLHEIDYLKPALEIPYCHHEKWDGSGYPRGLQGKQIPLAARIFSLVDVWDALGSDRPYRKAWKQVDIYTYILEQSGKYFDPEVVEAWVNEFGIQV